MKNLIFLLILISVYSCNDSLSDLDLSTCEKMPAEQVIEINTGSTTESFEIWTGYNDKVNDINYSFASKASNTSNPELLSVLDLLGVEQDYFSNGQNICNIVMYATVTPNELSNINSSIISGLLVYEHKLDGKFSLRLFEKVNNTGKYIQNTKFSSTVSSILINDYYTLSKIVNKQKTNITAIRLIDRDKIKNKPTSFSKELYHKIYSSNEMALSQLANNSNSATNYSSEKQIIEDIGSNGGCPEPCHDRSGACDDIVLACEGDTAECSFEYADSISAKKANKNTYRTLYRFKNEILVKSQLGRHIINDYYFLSDHLKDKLTINIATKAISITLSDVTPMLNKLINNPNSSDILYGKTTKEKLIDFVEEVRVLSSDQTFNDMLDEVVELIELEANKSISAIYQDFS